MAPNNIQYFSPPFSAAYAVYETEAKPMTTYYDVGSGNEIVQTMVKSEYSVPILQMAVRNVGSSDEPPTFDLGFIDSEGSTIWLSNTDETGFVRFSERPVVK